MREEIKPKIAPEVEITPEMIEAAMQALWRYSVASEYVDRYMMKEFLWAALHAGQPR